MFSIPRSVDPLLGHPNNLNHGYKNYTVAGSYLFAVPEGVFSVCVTAIGGGYGSNGGDGANSGGWGTNGALQYKNIVPVVPGQVITVVVGGGGTGGGYPSGAGTAGSASTFGSYVTAISAGNSGGPPGYLGIGLGGQASAGASPGYNGSPGAVLVEW